MSLSFSSEHELMKINVMIRSEEIRLSSPQVAIIEFGRSDESHLNG